MQAFCEKRKCTNQPSGMYSNNRGPPSGEPCMMGPMATHRVACCTTLYVLLPASPAMVVTIDTAHGTLQDYPTLTPAAHPLPTPSPLLQTKKHPGNDRHRATNHKENRPGHTKHHHKHPKRRNQRTTDEDRHWPPQRTGSRRHSNEKIPQHEPGPNARNQKKQKTKRRETDKTSH